MTLCLAWKSGNNIHFASDSRLTISFTNRQEYVDVGIKVFSVPVKIYSAIDVDTGKKTLDYDHSIGLCFAGYTTNAYIVKETITEILQRLQYSDYTDFSMDGIVRLIGKFYEHTSRKLGNVLFSDGDANFFITGYCPKDKILKAYKFELDKSTYPVYAKIERILEDNKVEFLGSGKSAAKKLQSKRPELNALKILREVIRDEAVNSVGGNIQYGDFDNNANFKVKGVDDYEISDDQLIRRKLVLRGTQLYENDIKLDYNDFHISYDFIQPFENEVQAWLKDYLKDE